MLFIPEPDLYRLIFSSKLPAAEKFTDWVVCEILPTIRKFHQFVQLLPVSRIAKIGITNLIFNTLSESFNIRQSVRLSSFVFFERLYSDEQSSSERPRVEP